MKDSTEHPKYKLLILSTMAVQAKILQRLTEDWSLSKYTFLSCSDVDSKIKLIKYAKYFFSVFRRIKKIFLLKRQEKNCAILCCSGSILDLPASFIVSRLIRVPFYFYVFDDFIYQWPSRVHRFFARLLEFLVIKGTKLVIAPNEYLAAAYRSRYNIDVKIVSNPIAMEDKELTLNNIQKLPLLENKDLIRIVYTGSVYHAHFDAFRNLIKAINEADRKIELHIFSSQPKELLEKHGIVGPVVLHPYCSDDQVKTLQENADVLFLPLAFNSTIPETLRTSAPGKMGEYLISRRPILVHAPENSFLSYYFKKNNCGTVADKNDWKFLQEKLLSILEDKNTQQVENMIQNAFLVGVKDFSLTGAKKVFLNLFLDNES